MSQPIFEGGMRRNFTATDTIPAPANGTAVIVGIFVASSTSGTIKLADSVGTIVNTTSVSGATFYPMPFPFSGTLTITVTGTLDATIGWTTA